MIMSTTFVQRNGLRIAVGATLLLFLVFHFGTFNISPPGVSSYKSGLLNGHKVSRLHYLVPSSLVKPPLCAVVSSALVQRYAIPTIVGYKGQGDYDAKKAHIAKLRAIKRYLYSEAGEKDDDLVVVVDGFDVLAQIPAETMIERYFDFIARADQKLADQRGISVEELHATDVRQTVLWGTDKGCFPSGGSDPRCWLVPFSTLPRYKWGPKTENGELIFSDSRFLNSGTVIGPLGDLRTFIDATLMLIEDTWDPDFRYHDSDQYYISTMYARQEYQRAVDLNDGEFPGEIGERHVPRPKQGVEDVTEYHVMVDHEAVFTQTQCHNNRFLHKLQYKNHDHTATMRDDVLEEGPHFKPYQIQMPSNLFQALIRVFESLPEDERPAMSPRNWVRHLKLGTNIGTEIIYAFYHNTCSKRAFLDKYNDSWYFPLIRPLLRASTRAVQEKKPIGPKPIDGRMWLPIKSYPEGLEDEFGGVYTDFEEEAFIPLQQFCSQNLTSIIGPDIA
ncbi:hypothetical protein FZEAL_8296 [Fusarium zealandicum]|uniref:Uncharacterized protein n=1 Tax=Fusarium zealandicum TaxID=1053134 RepID=A0A8H4UE04_9HYPO|nr:hypothetical protein FZEAL_8296 [Fusarium zealandicum]